MPTSNKPSAIYVWLVPSEEVLDQPGNWRIRKWDTAPFPEANFTLARSEKANMLPSVPVDMVFPERNEAPLTAGDLEWQRKTYEEHVRGDKARIMRPIRTPS